LLKRWALRQSKYGLPAISDRVKTDSPDLLSALLAEDREKASEARQTAIHRMTKKSTNNSISRKKISPFHPHKPGVIFLLQYAVVDSSLCFTT